MSRSPSFIAGCRNWGGWGRSSSGAPGAGPDADPVAGHPHRLAERRHHAVGERVEGAIVDAWDRHDEVVATASRHKISIASLLIEKCGDLLEQPIPLRQPIGLVEYFEIVITIPFDG